MNELIKITKTSLKQDTEEINTVDARELHGFLESKQEFSHWIKNRIQKYDFVEGIDFASHDKFIMTKGTNVGANRKEYALAISIRKRARILRKGKR